MKRLITVVTLLTLAILLAFGLVGAHAQQTSDGWAVARLNEFGKRLQATWRVDVGPFGLPWKCVVIRAVDGPAYGVGCYNSEDKKLMDGVDAAIKDYGVPVVTPPVTLMEGPPAFLRPKGGDTVVWSGDTTTRTVPTLDGVSLLELLKRITALEKRIERVTEILLGRDWKFECVEFNAKTGIIGLDPYCKEGSTKAFLELIERLSALEKDNAELKRRVKELEKPQTAITLREHKATDTRPGYTTMVAIWDNVGGIAGATKHRWVSDVLTSRPSKDCISYGTWRFGALPMVTISCLTGAPQIVNEMPGLSGEKAPPAWKDRESWTLDFCLTHGETRVLHSPANKEKP